MFTDLYRIGARLIPPRDPISGLNLAGGDRLVDTTFLRKKRAPPKECKQAALPLWPLSLSPAVVFIPETVSPERSLFWSAQYFLHTGGLAVPLYPSLYRRDLWQVWVSELSTAIPAVRKTSGSRVTESAGFAEPSAEDQATTVDLQQAAPGLGRDEHAPAADRDEKCHDPFK
ncbi:hypothetical protein DPMN_021137 [Dreissena polymorpha]|uniref:Uncharacterized protein n=1 Tax=Dreissena polymorpha TaxID=45954 RepID=A0A9D4SAT3_DREPO|nr:hypothetical protein DPMN_021137 [Dreissena polymorpha]